MMGFDRKNSTRKLGSGKASWNWRGDSAALAIGEEGCDLAEGGLDVTWRNAHGVTPLFTPQPDPPVEFF